MSTHPELDESIEDDNLDEMFYESLYEYCTDDNCESDDE